MAHKKGQGSVRNGRDSNAKYLGVKKYAGETVKAGNATSSFVSAVLTSTVATMWAWAGTSLCSPSSMAR